MARLKRKTAVITGAADGIGHAISDAMAREGAHVVISDIADAQGEAFAVELRAAGHKADYVHCDVSQDADIAKAIETAVSKTGRLDVMGGIADYSGSLVLEWPSREATYAAVQPADDGLIRVSVGLEDPQDLLEDLEQALATA